tara:strand:- start:396 stop:641 length:246 start_codon:yes stop_codon:yes gene_type:complete
MTNKHILQELRYKLHADYSDQWHALLHGDTERREAKKAAIQATKEFTAQLLGAKYWNKIESIADSVQFEAAQEQSNLYTGA